MIPSPSQLTRRTLKHGQVLVLFVFLVVVLLLFVGFVVDIGFAYVTKSSMSKAVDAAALTAAQNVALGQAGCEQAARDIFAANYSQSGREASFPTVTVDFLTNPDTGLKTMKVNARTVVNTYFIRVLPSWKNLTIGASAEATRARIIMSLVLDRSGSMRPIADGGNDGCTKLPPAVDAFLGLFDDTADHVGLVTYASTAREDFPISMPFKTGCSNAVPRSCPQYVGYTFSEGGLELASNQVWSLPAASYQNVARVVVFFTDGLANTFQYTVTNCPPAKLWNITGGDTGNDVVVLDPTTGAYQCCDGLCSAHDGAVIPCCPAFTEFDSVNGMSKFITGPDAGFNVRTEGKLKALAVANAMRDAGVTVYAIGLGIDVDVNFLQQIANDPQSAYYNSRQPTGKALIAPTAGQLQDTFRTLAKSILLRLVS
jgi:Flp pilus assembly protein TadG